ncbi:hypothetical protein EHE19_011175 [Ruminiclostridium herbifermentans]|uniref:PsbP C-terminal domain-containing protein n=2 Tax=Ruminiclostridium herbifermentans TaxID=2488810 RepID=A0A7H1VJC8_9FIRM|nr:hypothetical protein EHE19_011175 [Ruminiclostridium herbifermentans]
MYLLLVKNYKKNIIIISSAVIFLIFSIVGLKILLDKPPKYNVILDKNLYISFPFSFRISDIYSINFETAPYIQTSASSHKKFLDFKSPEEGFEFSYPSMFELIPSNLPGGEILYHIDFKNKNDISKNGFVQVWKLPYSIEEFLENSKNTAMLDFIDFKSKKICINGLDGYLWDYSYNSTSGKYKALEAFLYKDSKLYRVSYFLPLNQYNSKEYDIFWNIVDSIKINKKPNP